jgi:hypothetical protein
MTSAVSSVALAFFLAVFVITSVYTGLAMTFEKTVSLASDLSIRKHSSPPSHILPLLFAGFMRIFW